MTSETLNLRVAPLSRGLTGRPIWLRVSVVLAGSWLLAAASWVQIPMYPVPMTLQTFGLFVIAGLAGPRMTFEILVVWLLQAAIGLPVLAGGASGIDHLTGPTAGFLGGMLVAGPLCAWLVLRSFALWPRGVVWSFALGHIIVLALGWVWLAINIGAKAALHSGVAPFILGAAVKTAAAALVVLMARAHLKVIEVRP